MSATGDLTLHGVTKSVTIPIHAVVAGDVATVTGSVEIQFADFSIQQPSSFFVLSIEDHGTMELSCTSVAADPQAAGVVPGCTTCG